MALDILILVVAVGAFIMGFVKGILGQVGQIAGVIVGIAVSRIFGSTVAGWFASAGGPTAFETVCGYAVTFVVAFLGVWLLIRAVKAVINVLYLGFVDRLAGAIFNLILWCLMLSLAVNLYAVATNDVKLLDGDSHKPWRTAVIRLAPVVLGYIGSDALNKISTEDVFNYDTQQSVNDKDE